VKSGIFFVITVIKNDCTHSRGVKDTVKKYGCTSSEELVSAIFSIDFVILHDQADGFQASIIAGAMSAFPLTD